MKKSKIAAFITFFALGSSVFAAGTADTNKDQTVLTVLDYRDATQANTFEDERIMWESFQKENPDIKLEIEVLFNEPFHQKTAAYATSGKMPDVFYMYPGGRSTLIHEKKLAKDLLPFLEKDNLVKDYNPECVSPENQVGGYLAEIPFGMSSTHMLYVNTKVLKSCGLSVPKTYNELKAQVPVLKKAGYETILMANMDDWVMQSCLFSMVIGRFGGKSWVKNIKNGSAKFTDQFFLNAVTFIEQMYKDGVISQSSLATSYGDVLGLFATGKGAYLIDGDWRTAAFITDKSTNTALISTADQKANIELTVMPEIPGEVLHNSNSSVVATGYGMSSKIAAGSKKEEAAWRLIKWLSGPVIQQRRLETGEAFPSLIKGITYDSTKMEPLMIKRADFYKNQGPTTPVFDSEFSATVNSACNTSLQSMAMGKMTPEEVCAAVQTAYEASK